MAEIAIKLKLSTLIMLLAIPDELYEYISGVDVGKYDNGQVQVTFHAIDLQSFAKLLDVVDNTSASDDLAEVLESTSVSDYLN